MKKLALVIGLIIGTLSYHAQQSQLNFYVGPSFGAYQGGVFNVDYEIPMLDDNLTIGPSLGLGMGRYGYLTEGVVIYHNYMIFNPAVVGHYYFDWLIPDMDERFDVFAKAKAGIRYSGGNYAYSGLRIDLNLQAGGRWHFSSKGSLYLALGYAWAPMNLGVTLRL